MKSISLCLGALVGVAEKDVAPCDRGYDLGLVFSSLVLYAGPPRYPIRKIGT